jgi:hypothetical protein
MYFIYKSHTAVISLLNNNDAILNISDASIDVILMAGNVSENMNIVKQWVVIIVSI